MLIIFLDTETTGLNPRKHRTIEIAFKAYQAENSKVIFGYETLIAQSMEVFAEHDPESLKITGLTYEETLKGKTEKAVESEIILELNRLGIKRGNAVFCCQNPSFDRAFFSQIINPDLQEGFDWPYHWLDLASMYWAITIKKGMEGFAQIEKNGLSKDSIAKAYGLPEEAKPHRAMNGVNHLMACYEAVCGSLVKASLS